MVFNSRNSRIYYGLIGRPKYSWYLITIFISILFIFNWFYFIKKPLDKILLNHQKNLAELKKSLGDLPLDSYKNFEKRSLKENLNRLSQNFSKIDQDDYEIIKIIDQAAKSGLIIKLYDNKPELNKSWYNKFNYEFEIEGEFEAISKLLERINNQNPNLRFLNFVAKTNTDGLINLKMLIQMLGIKNEKN